MFSRLSTCVPLICCETRKVWPKSMLNCVKEVFTYEKRINDWKKPTENRLSYCQLIFANAKDMHRLRDFDLRYLAIYAQQRVPLKKV